MESLQFTHHINSESFISSIQNQSVFRIYRLGQKKHCYVYRFIGLETIEQKIYERQLTKLATAKRVIDGHIMDRHFTPEELRSLYITKKLLPRRERNEPILPEDDALLASQLQKFNFLFKFHSHNDLLEGKVVELLPAPATPMLQMPMQNQENENQAECLIFGFKPGVLLGLLKQKAKKTAPNPTKLAEIQKSLLSQLYSEMNQNKSTVYR